jgi:hypothetical protein
MNMPNLKTLPLLQIEQDTLCLGEFFQYLKLSGRLLPLMQEVVGQHCILKELQQRQDLQVTLADLEQAIINFRLQKQLTDAQTFERWLVSQGMDRATFQAYMVLQLKTQQLKAEIAAPDLQTLFEERQRDLELLNLSCVVVGEKELADQVYQVLTNNEANFDQAVQSLGLANNPAVSILRGPTRRVRLPQELQAIADLTQPGQLVGPMVLGQQWCVFRLEQRIPAQLEGNLQAELENQLFQRWLVEKIQKLTVKWCLDTPSEETVASAAVA